jgi:hypothetical protein
VTALAVAPLLAAESGQKGTGPQVVRGSIGPGALYELAIPANWNGDLVLFAHGYSDSVSWQDYLGPDGPPTGFAAGRLGEGLLALNYGVAYSSYAEPGFAIKDGAIRTRQLLGLFTKHFGKPKRTYLIGISMGDDRQHSGSIRAAQVNGRPVLRPQAALHTASVLLNGAAALRRRGSGPLRDRGYVSSTAFAVALGCAGAGTSSPALRSPSSRCSVSSASSHLPNSSRAIAPKLGTSACRSRNAA